MTNSTRTATLLLLAAFLLGAVAGAGVLALYGRPSRMGPGHPPGSSGYLSRLEKDLELSPVQRDSIGAILQRFEPRMDSIWLEVRPRFETLRGELRSGINAQLTPEQQRHYAELLERHDARRRNSKDSANAPR
jgi:Spy/CpxP family protein refolding chaperone